MSGFDDLRRRAGIKKVLVENTGGNINLGNMQSLSEAMHHLDEAQSLMVSSWEFHAGGNSSPEAFINHLGNVDKYLEKASIALGGAEGKGAQILGEYAAYLKNVLEGLRRPSVGGGSSQRSSGMSVFHPPKYVG